MENVEYFKDYRQFVSFQVTRCGKTTLFENEQVLVGLNCFNHGQEMEKHAHEMQNRFYLVLEGEGCIWVDDAQQVAAKGMVIWVPCGHTHRILNTGEEPLVLLVGISPAHAE